MLEYLRESLYDPVWKGIVRPPREVYSPHDLGPRRFKIQSRYYQRQDFRVFNHRGERLECSHFKESGSEGKPAVVFLHGNASSRLSAYKYIKYILPHGVDIVCFDFAGSGLSQGEFVTLGHNEESDLRAVVKCLRKERKVGAIVLWGRSMGAATALLYARGDQQLAGLVLDSPFSDLEQLMKEIACRYVPLPNFVLDFMVGMVAETILEKAKFDVREVKPYKGVQFIRVPTLFVSGTADQLVSHQHSEKLFQACKGQKDIVLCDGGHNDKRPKYVRNIAVHAILKWLGVNSRERKPVEEETELDEAIMHTAKIEKRSKEMVERSIEHLANSVKRWN